MSLGTMEQRTEGMKRQAQELIEQAYNRGFKAGYEVGFEECDEPNQQLIIKGMDMAWEAAELIAGDCLSGSEMTKELFNFNYAYAVFKNFSASEAISKIKAYEEQKKNEIKVGDEVISNCGNDKDKAVVIDIDVNVLHLLTENGCYISEEFKDVKKTNRNFSEIAEVLKKMQEGE